MGVQIGLTIVVPMYFEVVHHLSATESGIALIPIALTTPGSLLSGQAMLYWKHYKRAPVIGLCCALVALAFLIWRPDLPLAYVIAAAVRWSAPRSASSIRSPRCRSRTRCRTIRSASPWAR